MTRQRRAAVVVARPTLWGNVVWRVSGAWARRAHDCTAHGIALRCHGKCCTIRGYWPPSATGGVCEHLGPDGCQFSPEDKPVGCHLYPLLLRGETLTGHHISTMPNAHCSGNHGQGPMLIDALRSSLVLLFGQEQYDRVRADVVMGFDSYFEVPPDVAASMEEESVLQDLNLPVTARSLRVLNYPPPATRGDSDAPEPE